MQPRFGILTRVLAVAISVAGLGAISGALGSRGTDQLILSLLALGYLAVGIGLWSELRWAWWGGFGLTTVTVVLDLTLVHDGGWIPWLVFLILFAFTATWTKRAEQEPHPPDSFR